MGISTMESWEALDITGGSTTLYDIQARQDAQLDLAATGGSQAFTAGASDEEGYKREASRPFRVNTLKFSLNGADYTSGNIVVKYYEKLKSGGNYEQMWIGDFSATPAYANAFDVGQEMESSVAGIDTECPGLRFPRENVWGAKMIVDVSDDQSLDIFSADEVVGG